MDTSTARSMYKMPVEMLQKSMSYVRQKPSDSATYMDLEHYVVDPSITVNITTYVHRTQAEFLAFNMLAMGDFMSPARAITYPKLTQRKGMYVCALTVCKI